MGSMGVMDLGEAGILVQLSVVEGSKSHLLHRPMAHPRIAMGEAVGSCQCQKVVEGSSRKMVLVAEMVGEGNNRSLEKAGEEKEKEAEAVAVGEKRLVGMGYHKQRTLCRIFGPLTWLLWWTWPHTVLRAHSNPQQWRA